ncbi:DUF1697 domain-containing protein [Gimibacter soli]|uniref:DUF1697 domain-containing protein n=1 Tax=Gimibacter soli TaxID=3024400 RepID=A0AAE9XQ50_9PROT|nr:DUF1697 domain-containing protein [Gimibacter soli]WCL54326.1 DUF1697 domain-containing protein [Gimibacter soli]
MQTYIALLRAVNVGGTGKLPMVELKAMCEEIGFSAVKTYIASGNVLFKSPLAEAEVRQALEARLLAYAGKPVGVITRKPEGMAAALAANPFPGEAPNRTLVTFLNDPPPADTITRARHHMDEQIVLGDREIYIFYGDGMAGSKLQVPAAALGTSRNINTVTKLVAMADAL